jgi:hypothetical protein
MAFPHFLVLGAAKSGTVSLYHYLRQHPNIFMCPVNEPNFFALDGLDLRNHFHGPGDRATLRKHCIQDRAAYEALFTGARPGQKLGESSPLYLYSPHAPHRIQHHAPTARLIVLLRHPVDRAFSNFRHHRIAGIEPLSRFEQALAAEPARLAAGWGPWPFWAYRHVGNYADQLQRYLTLFPPGQLLICFYEQLRDDPQALLQKIFHFIGVSSDFVPDTSIRHNISRRPRIPTLHRLMTRPNPMKKAVKRALPTPFRNVLATMLRRLNEERQSLQPRLRRDLTQSYRLQIEQLQELSDQDLTHWLAA